MNAVDTFQRTTNDRQNALDYIAVYSESQMQKPTAGVTDMSAEYQKISLTVVISEFKFLH